MNLDVESPDEVSDVLREASDTYYQAAEYESGDDADDWEIIAKILATAADKIDGTISG